MRVIIAVLIIIVGLLGFVLFNFISNEVVEFQNGQLQTVGYEDIQSITVDNVEDLTTYSHRVSTYEHISNNLLKSTSLYIQNLSPDYLHIFYVQDEQLIQEEYMDNIIDLEEVNDELILVTKEKSELKTNLEVDDMTFYNIEGFHVIHVIPNKTGPYFIGTNSFELNFELIRKK